MTSALEEVLRTGAWQMSQAAIANEVAEYVERHTGLRDGAGRRLVVRNGHMPERELVTGIGPVKVRQRLFASVISRRLCHEPQTPSR